MTAKVSLVWKISFLYMIVFLLSIFFVSYLSFSSFQKETFNQIEESLGKTAVNWKTFINSSTEQIKEILISENNAYSSEISVLKNKLLENVKNKIAGEIIGKTGYIWVLNSRGDYVVSKSRARDGENIWNAQDSEGHLFIQEIINKGRNFQESYFTYYYPWKNTDEKKARMKIAGIIYLADLDWYVGASAYHDEFLSGLEKTKEKIVYISAVLAVAGIVIFVLFMLSVRTSLGVIADQANQIGEGRLDGMVSNKFISRGDEIGKLARSQKSMLENLSRTVSLVMSGAEQVAVASSQLSAGNNDLSKRTEQQAAALEELFSDMKQISGAIQEYSKNTDSANKISKTTLGKTSEGEISVNRMIGSINEIHGYSRKISDIIKLITEIVSQTNILAINASIEASHAGEQGKGFSVVAKEVRTLAERSQNALKEISNIIGLTNSKIDESVDIAGVAGDLLLQIKDYVEKLDVLIYEISETSKDNLIRAKEIEASLYNIDADTEKNVALVEESAVATEELSAQAQALTESIGYFKIN